MQFAHGDLQTVHKLRGSVTGDEFLVSALSKALQTPLGAIQPEPLVISANGGSEAIKYGGTQQAMLSPTFVKSLLTTPSALSAYEQTQALRDQDLDTLNRLLKSKRTQAQMNLLDSWATSQQQARALPANLMSQLSAIGDDSTDSQLSAASVLCQMKVTPAVIVHVAFGGDNHVDTNNDYNHTIIPGALPYEAAQHQEGVNSINKFASELKAAGAQDKITFATLTTFGRSNADAQLTGRAHNGSHTCNLIVGANVKPSLVGGATLAGENSMAMAIDSASGTGAMGGDIPYAETLAAYGKTLGAALGLSSDVISGIVSTGGKVVQAAVNVAP
jgi:hypothetical protein